MAYGLKALFFEKKNDEKARYEIEINGIVMPYMMIDEFGFMQVYLNEGYVDFMLEVTEDDINRMVFNHYGEEQYSYMLQLNQELIDTISKGDDCEKICLWIYEYDSLTGSDLSFSILPPIGLRIYSEKTEGSARYIDVYIENDTVKVVQQDLGPVIEQITGDYDYEREIVIPINELKQALGVSTTTEMLNEIKARFSSKDAIDKMTEFCTENNIKREYYSH